jgi:hypothetical protein
MYTIVPTAKLKFKGKIGRIGICSFSATIDIDRLISPLLVRRRLNRLDGEKTVGGRSWPNDDKPPSEAPRGTE